MELSMRGCRIGVVGLGYVGLPLAVEFGKHFDTVGFDIKAARIAELKKRPRQHARVLARRAARRRASSSTPPASRISASCRVFIVTVPTPIDRYNRPDLTPLERSSETVGKVLKKGDVVVYESTVYPGCTEEICIPILERESGLKFNKDFFAGYSPERINPGDKEHRLPSIKKVTSGSTPEVADFVDNLYRSRRARRHAQGVEHPRGRGRQGHREHAARREHRAHQRAGAALQPARHRHRGSAAGRGQQVELPAVPSRASSADIASAWILTT